jgi:hypothetical protein
MSTTPTCKPAQLDLLPVRDYPLIGTRDELARVLARANDSGQLVSYTTPVRRPDDRYTITIRLRGVIPTTTPALPAPPARRRWLRRPRISATTLNIAMIAVTAIGGIAFIAFGLQSVVDFIAGLGRYALIGLGVAVVALVVGGLIKANRCPTCGR